MVATDETTQQSASIAPGSVVSVRDEEWLVTRTEPASDGKFVHVQGLGELVRDSTAIFSDAIDAIEPLDPAAAKVVGDDTPAYRRTKLWLDAMLRKSPVRLHDSTPTQARRGLADGMRYQRSAERQSLRPDDFRPRTQKRVGASSAAASRSATTGIVLAGESRFSSTTERDSGEEQVAQ